MAAAGQIEVRLLPVGVLGSESLSIASAVLASKDPLAAWATYTSGLVAPETAVPPTEGRVRAEANLDRMRALGGTQVPLFVYKDASGAPAGLSGKPDDMAAFVAGINGQAR